MPYAQFDRPTPFCYGICIRFPGKDDSRYLMMCQMLLKFFCLRLSSIIREGCGDLPIDRKVAVLLVLLEKDSLVYALIFSFNVDGPIILRHLSTYRVAYSTVKIVII